MTPKPKIFLIVGPTACGKTSASIIVAKRIGAEIISADSIQVYRGLDIGSAKPTADEMDGVVHHLIDCVDIADTSYNVSAFRERAIECINGIISRGRIPLIVGGTGLYVNSLIYPLDFSSAEPCFERRDELAAMENAQPGKLHEMLSAIDPIAAARIHVNDMKRIIRAIEVFEQTGKTLTAHGGDFANSRGEDILFEPVIAGVTMDRRLLYERIEQRVDSMMRRGLLDEVKTIIDKGYSPGLPSLQGLGYKQLIMHLNGELSLDEAVKLIKRDTRRFAKRQVSWFKRDKRIRWFETDGNSIELADAICGYFEEHLLG